MEENGKAVNENHFLLIQSRSLQSKAKSPLVINPMDFESGKAIAQKFEKKNSQENQTGCDKEISAYTVGSELSYPGWVR